MLREGPALSGPLNSRRNRHSLCGPDGSEPSDKTGVSRIMTQVMRKGGTATWPGDKLDEELEFLPATVEVYAGMPTGYGQTWSAGKQYRSLHRSILHSVTRCVDSNLTVMRLG